MTTAARPIEEWHEDVGDVLWWRFPIEEPPYCGSPLDIGRTILVVVDGNEMQCNVGGWPGYHTHWTPIVCPELPAANDPILSPAEQKAQGKRCGCCGADDYCVCQNVPDKITRAERAAMAEGA